MSYHVLAFKKKYKKDILHPCLNGCLYNVVMKYELGNLAYYKFCVHTLANCQLVMFNGRKSG